VKTPRNPQDRRKYSRHADSCVALPGLADGEYVYVQDLDEQIWVVPDGPHTHPKVLGQALPALYAGTLRVLDNAIVELTNLSGTFRCDDDEGLIDVAEWLVQHGWRIADNAIRFFPFDGSRPYIILI
jgi:hypothetical protein